MAKERALSRAMAGSMTELSTTLIGEAIMGGYPDQVKEAISRGESPHVKDRKGNTYLHLICTSHKPYVFNTVMATGIDINSQNRDGNTPLHVAALHCECCHVPDLMACGVDPYIKNKDGKIAADIARDSKLWLQLYKKYEPGLRRAIMDHDIKRIHSLFNSWSAVHYVSKGKDMRQYAASLTYHDIVAIIDSYKFSLMAVYAVMERNKTMLDYALSRGPECNINFLRVLPGCMPHHILQDAIRQRLCTMVTRLLDGGTDVNIITNVKDYFRGPLYFEAVRFENELDKKIFQRVIKTSADLTLRDERGRSCLIYAIDRRQGDGYSHHMTEDKVDITLEAVQFLLDSGVDIAMRDDTGSTARDVAMFARRGDIVNAIDKHTVQMITSSDIAAVRSLAVKGYDHIMVDYQYRDSWIYAAGNDTPDMTRFLETLEHYQDTVVLLFAAIRDGKLSDLKNIIESCDDKDMLLYYKDKHGRGPLLTSIIHQQYDIFMWLLHQAQDNIHRDVDNLNRTALHYAYGVSDTCGDSYITELIHIDSRNTTTTDVMGVTPENMLLSNVHFLTEELKKTESLDILLHAVTKYEALLTVVKSKKGSLREFDKVLKTIQVPISQFPVLFHPGGHRLVSGYRDLLLAAIDHQKLDIAKKLINYDCDCSWKDEYPNHKSSSVEYMNAEERARYLGHMQIADYIVRKGKLLNYKQLLESES